MATNGVFSVVRGGVVLLKAVAGCNGQNVGRMTTKIISNAVHNIDTVLAAAEEVKFGCPDCLVVMDSSGDIHNPPDDPHTLERYWDTLQNPGFNPRWWRGSADYVEVVDLDKAPEMWIVRWNIGKHSGFVSHLMTKKEATGWVNMAKHYYPEIEHKAERFFGTDN